MLLQTARFDDVHLHAQAVLGWRQTYDQMTDGQPHTYLRHLTGERFQLFEETLDQRVTQRGQAPQGRLCMAMSLSNEASGLFQGQSLGSEHISLLRGGEDFFVHAAEGMRLLAVTVDLGRFARLAARELCDEQLRRLTDSSLVQVQGARLGRVRLQLQHLLNNSVESQDEKWLEQQVLEAMLDLLAQAEEVSRSRRGNSSVDAYLVRRCQELVMERPDEPLGILDLCEELRVSRRTLQSSFRTSTGLRPVEYLRSVRLNAARRRLRDDRSASLSVARVANDLGFTHLGHFSEQYKRLFGEQPSLTRRH